MHKSSMNGRMRSVFCDHLYMRGSPMILLMVWIYPIIDRTYIMSFLWPRLLFCSNVHINVCQRTRLITQILHYVLPLAENCFGNYVVQCLLELRIPWVTAVILTKLKGRYAHLLMKKHSSYVVEKCMEYFKEGQFAEIIQEIMESPLFLCALEDEFGNFAIQRALERTKGPLRASLMAAIEQYAPELKIIHMGRMLYFVLKMAQVEVEVEVSLGTEIVVEYSKLILGNKVLLC